LALDLLLSGDFLRNLLTGCARKTSKVGSRLEKEAAGFFRRELGIREEHMIESTIIANGAMEVDIAFVVNRTLFVIDCKAKAKDGVYMSGKVSSFKNRRDEFDTEIISKLPSRIRLLSEGHGAPAIHNEDFDRAVPLVCTSSVEYVRLDDQRLRRNGTLLVGTPIELLKVIRQISCEQLVPH
jgi:hypothetical protein